MIVEVAYAKPDIQSLVTIELPEGATVEAAIHASGILKQFPEVKLSQISAGIFGRICQVSDKLTPGDRVEIYRPLVADPRTARRQKTSQKWVDRPSLLRN